jgi:phage N-6-adenine-methyltransferase
MANQQVHYSSEDHTWETPADLFAVLNAEFNFELDVCATPATAKCPRYYTPEVDGLAQEWQGVCWMNPPYGREIARWMQKAHESAAMGAATVVCLVPARTDTGWWWRYARHGEIRFLPGRLRFGDAAHCAPFPSAVVVFRPDLPPPACIHWDWRRLPAKHGRAGDAANVSDCERYGGHQE